MKSRTYNKQDTDGKEEGEGVNLEAGVGGEEDLGAIGIGDVGKEFGRRQQGSLLQRRLIGCAIVMIVLVILGGQGGGGSGDLDLEAVGGIKVGGSASLQVPGVGEGRVGGSGGGGGGWEGLGGPRKPPDVGSILGGGGSSGGDTEVRVNYEFNYPLKKQARVAESGSGEMCRNSNPSGDAKVAIVLQGKYTHGYLHYCLQSIEKAFGVGEVDVFIYAMYQNEQEREGAEEA